MAYKVKGALVSVKGAEGRQVYFYEAAILPNGIDKAEIERLLELGLIEESDEAPAKGADSRDADAGANGPSSGEVPSGNASLVVWQEFARSKGAADEDLDGKTRDQLREQYGPKE
jgi:hypothetical protein